MHYKRFFHRRSPYVYSDGDPDKLSVKRKPGLRLVLISVLATFLLFILTASVFLKDISSQIAISDASDIVTISVFPQRLRKACA